MPNWRIWRRSPRFHLDWLQVEVSALCNGACTYCPQSCYREQWHGGLMDWRTFECLEPSFPHIDLVYLQGWGEPLLHPGIWRMVRRVQATGAATGFTTNGTLLDDRNIERLIESGLDILAVSLAGTTAGTHERFRPGCDFRAIGEALIELTERKRKRGTEFPRVHLAFLLLTSNLDEVGRLAELAHRWGASQVVVSSLSWIATEDMRAECTLLQPETWPRAAQTLETAKRAAAEHGILFHYHGPAVGQTRLVCPENIHNSCYVSHGGDVSPCVFTHLSLDTISPAFHYFEGRARPVKPVLFGNVCEQSLPEIWHSEMASRFRDTFADRPPTACQHCHRIRGG